MKTKLKEVTKENTNFLELYTKDLKIALADALKVISRDSIRNYGSVVRLEKISNDRIAFVSTDGFQLCKTEINGEFGSFDDNTTVHLTHETTSMLYKMATTTVSSSAFCSTVFTISECKNETSIQFRTRLNTVTIRARNADIKYPDYKRVMPVIKKHLFQKSFEKNTPEFLDIENKAKELMNKRSAQMSLYTTSGVFIEPTEQRPGDWVNFNPRFIKRMMGAKADLKAIVFGTEKKTDLKDQQKEPVVARKTYQRGVVSTFIFVPMYDHS